MLFNSIEFLLFFVVVCTTYFASKHQWRWVILLVASYFFYMWWKPAFGLLILGSTCVDFLCGIQLGKASNRISKRLWLTISLIVNFGTLFFFKYFNFAAESIHALTESSQDFQPWDIVLPVGISFYTFQTVSYTVDVYRGRQKVETHFGKFALYVVFFPQLVAGPIERSTRLLPQIFRKVEFEYERVVQGGLLMAWGMFKKVVVADRLATYVDNVYSMPGDHSPHAVALATYFFAFQIYCDFSGYSDIAIGTARVLGFDLMDNFKRPYFASSLRSFWERWHISLSTWFRDYLYIPLGGSKVGVGRGFVNVIFVFLVSGLWHGANWTFIVWGGLHGVYLVIERVLGKLLPNIKGWFWKYGKIVLTFHLVVLAWVFFRADSIDQAVSVIQLIGDACKSIPHGLTTNIVSRYEFIVSIASIGVLLIVDLLNRKEQFIEALRARSVAFRWSVYCLLIFAVLAFGVFNKNEFIYFQF